MQEHVRSCHVRRVAGGVSQRRSREWSFRPTTSATCRRSTSAAYLEREGRRDGPDREPRAARAAPPAAHGHDPGRGDHEARGGQGAGALHADGVDGLLAAAHVRRGRRHGDDHDPPEPAAGALVRRRPLADPPRLQQDRLRQQPRLEPEDHRAAAAPPALRHGRDGRHVAPLRRALPRADRRHHGEPARGDAGLALLRARDLAGDGPRRGPRADGPRRRARSPSARPRSRTRSSRRTARPTSRSRATSSSSSRRTTRSSRRRA